MIKGKNSKQHQQEQNMVRMFFFFLFPFFKLGYTISFCCFKWQEKPIPMAPHSSALAWKILWMEEPGRLQSTGSQRVRHDWATSLSLFTFMHWRGKWQPLQCSSLENPRDRGAWWAAVYGVAQSRTRLKQLSRSSPMFGVFSDFSCSLQWVTSNELRFY